MGIDEVPGYIERFVVAGVAVCLFELDVEAIAIEYIALTVILGMSQ